MTGASKVCQQIYDTRFSRKNIQVLAKRVVTMATANSGLVDSRKQRYVVRGRILISYCWCGDNAAR